MGCITLARARNIKPGFYKNEDLAECSIWARYIFPGLWMLADREGRLEDRPKRIKGELIPFDSQDVEPLLRELATRGFIVRYQIDAASFIQISKFSTHQAPHYSEKTSVIKPPALPEIKGHIHSPNSGKLDLIKMGSQPPDSLIPDSLNPSSPNPDSPNPESRKKLSSAASRSLVQKPKANGKEAKSGLAWEAYSAAYCARHGTEPVRNAKVNSALAALVDRLGVEEAPKIAAFYVSHNNPFYVRDMHSTNLLLRDAEKLRTEWATDKRMTTLEARGAEQGDAMREQIKRVEKILDEER